MRSPVSSETHNEYKTYPVAEAVKLLSFINLLKENACTGSKTPYYADTFINHAIANRHSLKQLIDAALLQEEPQEVNVPANMLFWVYRACISMDIDCVLELPHICKLPSPKGEKFFVASKHEWIAHREATYVRGVRLKVSDHAKLGYLSRVMGIDVDASLIDFPFAQILSGKGNRLEDGTGEIYN